jgi:predicted metal-dependent hydrolase
MMRGMEYRLKRVRRSRSVKVRVEAGGEVVVTAPWLAPKFMIERFVKQNEAWITRQKARTRLKQDIYPTFNWDQKTVSYLGKLYGIQIHPRGESSLHLGGEEQRINLKDDEIILSPITGLASDARKMLGKWLQHESERFIGESLGVLSQKMGLKHGTVRFRQQKSRWGSCTGEGNLSFNWRLVHFKPEIINYVVIHELAHIKHHDHSPAFWQLVAKFDPTYKTKRQFLHKQMVSLI